MNGKRAAKYGARDVSINHDLTSQEQATRRELIPQFKALGEKNFPCTLPQDVILSKSRPMSTDEIAHMRMGTLLLL